MLKSRTTPTLRRTVAYIAGRKITLAPVACPFCAREMRAADAELQDDDQIRIVCACCHVDILAVEKP